MKSSIFPFLQHNILKICDFGLARDLKTIMTKGPGTLLWMAPEVKEVHF